MKINKKKMPLLQKIFYIASFIFLICSFIYLGTKDFNLPQTKLTDNEAFAMEYGISKNNSFTYKTSKEIIDILKQGSGIILLSYPENKWSKNIAETLNSVGNENNIKEIYYYNFKKDKSNNNRFYVEITEFLKSYLPVIDMESIELRAPTVIMVKNGKILYYNDETSIVRGKETIEKYWTNERILNKKEEFQNAIKDFMGGMS